MAKKGFHNWPGEGVGEGGGGVRARAAARVQPGAAAGGAGEGAKVTLQRPAGVFPASFGPRGRNLHPRQKDPAPRGGYGPPARRRPPPRGAPGAGSWASGLHMVGSAAAGGPGTLTPHLHYDYYAPAWWVWRRTRGGNLEEVVVPLCLDYTAEGRWGGLRRVVESLVAERERTSAASPAPQAGAGAPGTDPAAAMRAQPQTDDPSGTDDFEGLAGTHGSAGPGPGAPGSSTAAPQPPTGPGTDRYTQGALLEGAVANLSFWADAVQLIEDKDARARGAAAVPALMNHLLGA